MAIDVNNARFLLYLKRKGVDFREVATVGRQGLFIPAALMRELYTSFGVTPAINDEKFYTGAAETYSEYFFKELGTTQLDVIDYSAYEGANIIHDMNTPVPENLKNKFKVLIDSGSIEHMFHFPQAIRNYMDLLIPGGKLILLNMPVNNHMGHGFYQFSPELFYNVLSPANGFAIGDVFVAEDFPFSDFYHVTDPKKVQERICLCNDNPVLLFLEATKTGSVDRLTFPVQNDYVTSWSGGSAPAASGQAPAKRMLQKMFAAVSHRAYFRFSVTRNWNRLKKKYSLSNDRFFHKTDLEAVASTPKVNP